MYLVMPNATAAQARSRQQASQNGCDGVHSVFWWPIVPITGGAAVLIDTGSPFYGTQNLTQGEINQLVATVPGYSPPAGATIDGQVVPDTSQLPTG